MRQATKKMITLKAIQSGAKAEFKGLKMNFILDSSSSDDDDVQAGGRAKIISAADNSDSDDELNTSGGADERTVGLYKL
jgi:hypothetical protein